MDLRTAGMPLHGQVLSSKLKTDFLSLVSLRDLRPWQHGAQNVTLACLPRVLACSSRSVYADSRISEDNFKSKLAHSASLEGRNFVDSKITRLEPIRTLLLDNYDSYTYNLFQLLSVVNGVAPVVMRNDEISWEDLKHLMYVEQAFHNVVISPGPGTPVRATDIGICVQLLKECGDIPVLGVCMGHQALGYAHGAKIVHAPEPVHGRLSEIEHNGDLLFRNIPSGSGSGFKVVRYHSLMVDPASLPDDLVATAWTVVSDISTPSTDCERAGPSASLHSLENGWSLRHDLQNVSAIHMSSALSNGSAGYDINGTAIRTHDVSEGLSSGLVGSASRVLMGVSHRVWPHHGVQFHPESIATAYGRQILENFASITREFWKHQAWKPLNLVGGQRNSGDMTLELQGSLLCAPNLQLRVPGLGTDALHMNPSSQKKHDQSQLLKDAELAPAMDSQNNGHAVELEIVWRKLAGLASQAGGSDSIFCDLFGAEAGHNTFWLDSSTRDQGRARFSFMGGKGGPLWRQFTYKLSDDMQTCGILRVEDVAGNITEQKLDAGFFDFLEKALQNYTCKKEDFESFPFDFCGGFIGYLGYELKVECGARFNLHSSPHPDAGFFLADRMVVVDHASDDVYILASFQDTSASATVSNYCRLFGSQTDSVESSTPTAKQQAEEWVQGTLDQILLLKQKQVNAAELRRQLAKGTQRVPKGSSASGFRLQTCRSSYITDAQKCLSYIRDGESYEVCLTTHLRTKVESLDSLGLYLTLRAANPAPYAAWLDFGGDGPYICCSSPERFLRLDQTGTLEAKPIKGTMPRGASQAEDDALRHQLQNSEKDLAENLMIVDLLRNDLGIVCEAGSVHVPSLMAVESYATVHTLVSTVRGKKRSDITPVACIRAAFPGGSMTGAPKVRTMEILDSIESSARGVYSGTIGFLSFNSSFDLNIVIRTLVMNEGEASIGAGGAVVALSDPQAEYEEMLLKTRAPVGAFSKFESSLMGTEKSDCPEESDVKVRR